VYELFLSKTDALYGLSALRTSLNNFIETQFLKDTSSSTIELVNRVYSMGLKGMGTLLSALPAEVIEEEIPRFKLLVIRVNNFFVVVDFFNDGHAGSERREPS
jgi:hypothetical protein